MTLMTHTTEKSAKANLTFNFMISEKNVLK